MGTYNGSGVSGNRIYLDSNGDGTGTGAFQPTWVLIKENNNAGSWHIYDDKRASSGTSNRAYLLANTVNIENFAGSFPISFQSDGFSLDNIGNGTNRGTGSYIYLAIK